MSGIPLDISRELVRRTLDELRADDHFNLVYFSGASGQLWDRARPRTAANVAEAKRFLERLSGGGRTEMMAGVRHALAAHHEPELLQMFVFLTDGYVAEDQQILEVVKNERGGARFFDMIDSPVLVDIAIDWNGLPVRDVYPVKVRDLFAGQTISVLGRYERAARGTAYVTGRVGDRRVRTRCSWSCRLRARSTRRWRPPGRAIGSRSRRPSCWPGARARPSWSERSRSSPCVTGW